MAPLRAQADYHPELSHELSPPEKGCDRVGERKEGRIEMLEKKKNMRKQGKR